MILQLFCCIKLQLNLYNDTYGLSIVSELNAQ